MFGIPLSSDISPSRTYMMGIYDPDGLNDIRFDRMVLPESAPNSVQSAMQNYILSNIEPHDLDEGTAIHIMACIAIEDYLKATRKPITEEEKENLKLTNNMIFTDEEQEFLNPTIKMFTEKEREDIELTLKMLYEWNSKQINQAESYSMILTGLLKRVALMDDFDSALIKLKEKAFAVLQIE